MKKYVAFLRGINVSGKNKIDMSKLKECVESAGFTDVSTYLNSGNVTFSTDEVSPRAIIENRIRDDFGLKISVYIIEMERLQEVLENAPSWWDSGDKTRYDNLIFILTDDSPEYVCELIGAPTEDLEQVQIYQNVIFWTFDRSKYQKCNWWKKTAADEIKDKLTIRTANTIKKICK